MQYEWEIRSYGKRIRHGLVEGDTERQAKRKATEAAGVGHWKKAWRSELNYWVKYGGGDGRLSNTYSNYRGQRSTVQLVLRKIDPGEQIEIIGEDFDAARNAKPDSAIQE